MKIFQKEKIPPHDAKGLCSDGGRGLGEKGTGLFPSTQTATCFTEKSIVKSFSL